MSVSSATRCPFTPAGLATDQFRHVRFFFCGMIEEPVQKRSDSSMNRSADSSR